MLRVLEFARRIGHDGGEDAKGVTYDPRGALYVVGVARQSATTRANLFLRKYQGSTLVREQKEDSSALWITEATSPAVSVADGGDI